VKTNLIFPIFILIFLFSCKKDSDSDEKLIDKDVNEKFVPTDVIVKTKGYFTIDKVFNFINSFDHDVEYITNAGYTSSLPSDSLQYVLAYLNAKKYTNDGNRWFVTGYLHYQTKQITIFPKLFNIKNKVYQADWLKSIITLKLKEQTDKDISGYTIFFHVPKGTEKEWVKKFKTYNFIQWAELNYILELNPWP
jgi:hypothetical protein